MPSVPDMFNVREGCADGFSLGVVAEGAAGGRFGDRAFDVACSDGR